MTNKKTSSAKSVARVQQLENRLMKLAMTKKPKPKQQKKATPFRDVGTIAGKAIGGMFGSSTLGGGIGRWLGTGIGSIFGSGDYVQAGSSPAYNVLANDSQIPQFNTTRQTNVVCHREYIGDIQGTAGFNNTAYPLNPGMAQTFPWLSSVAANYQEYRFHGLVFEFRSLITDFVTSGAPGVIVMSTNYNADVPNYTTKQAMENAEFAVSTKPTINLMHGVECALSQTILPEKYVRTGVVPAGQDLRLYDLGNFQLATQQNPIQDLGELWVTYCVEFYKPLLPNDVGGNVLSSHMYRTGVTAAAPYGTATVITTGQLAVTITGTSLSWFAYPGQQYYVTVNWASSTPFVASVPAISFTGLAPRNYFSNDSNSFFVGPNSGVTTSTETETSIVTCSLLNPGVVSYSLGTTGTFGATTSCDIFVMELDNAVTA